MASNFFVLIFVLSSFISTMLKPGKVFLYAGLSALLVAFLWKWAGLSAYGFWVLLCAAVALKTMFLVYVIRAGRRPGAGFYLIVAGVGMILISLLFKHVYPLPVLNRILFYGAISLKVTGLILMAVRRKKNG